MKSVQRIIQTYAEFIGLLNEAGFVTLGGSGPVLGLNRVTPPENWHTGLADTDPWEWKRLLCERRDGTYTRARGHLAFFISWDWLPSFIAAYTPELPAQERYEMGLVSRDQMAMRALFMERPVWARHEIRSQMPDLKKSALERGLNALMADMEIVISGEAQKLSWDGRPVGWPSCAYERMENWAGARIFEQAMQRNPVEERQKIREQAAKFAIPGSEDALDKLFGA